MANVEADLPAKIAAPRLANVYLRTRLFERLDEARHAPVVWISSPAGAGKTTLATSYLHSRNLAALWYQVDGGDDDLATFFHYLGLAARYIATWSQLPQLTPEYQAGLAAFTRNFFRELYRRLPRPSVLVFDNYQDAPDGAALHTWLPIGFGEIPADINVLVLSREEPPAGFARLIANGAIVCLDWHLLQLTGQEANGIARLRLRNSADAEAIASRALPQAHGWAAGLVLLLEQAQGTPTASFSSTSDFTRVFDYFASEIFKRMQPSVQEFLLRTAFLLKMTLVGVERLTNNADAARILQDLAQRNHFTTHHAQGSFEYHPLFRSFLINRAGRHFMSEEIRCIQRQCAQILADDGEVEAGIALLQQAQDWTGVVPLILSRAHLLMEQGRTQTLAGWLLALPDEVRAHHGWVLYWLGACRLLYNPRAARQDFQTAFALFEREAASDPLYLAWTGIVDTCVVEWHFVPVGTWLDKYPSLQSGRAPPSMAVEAASLLSYISASIYHRPDDASLDAHMERVEAMLAGNPRRWFTQAAALVYCSLWARQLGKAERLLRALAPTMSSPNVAPPANVIWHALTSLHAVMTGDPALSACLAETGLALAHEHGVHSFDRELSGHYIVAQLLCGKVSAARELADRVLPDTVDASVKDSYFLFAAASVSLHEGSLARAEEEVNRSIRFNLQTGVPFGDAMNPLCRAVIRGKRGATAAALQEIEQARAIGSRIASPMVGLSAAIAEANVHLWRGEHALALRAFDTALRIASEDGRITFPAWQMREDAAALCNMALGAGVHVDFVQQLITRMQLPLPAQAVAEGWPFPLKVYTLGRFAIVRDAQPLKSPAKAQKKTLELIKALIAFGGRAVAEARLCDALWPDASADLARQNLKATLHRARKLIGAEAITVAEAKLSLNPVCCWCDAWALERHLNAALAPSNDSAAALAASLDAALKFARGPFLGAEDLPFALQTRERLRNKLLRALTRTVRALRSQGTVERSIEYAERGLDVDPLAESLYQELMQCHISLGRNAEALATYERCRRHLESLLGVAPAALTQSLQLQACGARGRDAPARCRSVTDPSPHSA